MATSRKLNDISFDYWRKHNFKVIILNGDWYK